MRSVAPSRHAGPRPPDSNRGASGEGLATTLRALHMARRQCQRGENVPGRVLRTKRRRTTRSDGCEAWCCESTSFFVARGEFDFGLVLFWALAWMEGSPLAERCVGDRQAWQSQSAKEASAQYHDQCRCGY